MVTAPMIAFGPWSLTLALASIHGLVVAGLLLRTTRNRLANRCLAALLVLCVLQITPYTIGYAGFYDAWPWLTFAPFFWQLGCGPLIWLYVRQLGEVALPARWGVHFVPLGLQVAYYMILFVQPLEVKWAWNDAMHTPCPARWCPIATPFASTSAPDRRGARMTWRIRMCAFPLQFRSVGLRRQGRRARRRASMLPTAARVNCEWPKQPTRFLVVLLMERQSRLSSIT